MAEYIGQDARWRRYMVDLGAIVVTG